MNVGLPLVHHASSSASSKFYTKNRKFFLLNIIYEYDETANSKKVTKFYFTFVNHDSPSSSNPVYIINKKKDFLNYILKDIN
ncbi:hypothetical protein HanPSC8_Chr01g0021661 [Helianthus annuus]|nr:hypothetical protein HanPSC8_Chr01g0021661 [Helianthus annuus]